MNRVDLLLQTPAVALTFFDHPPATTHCDPASEVAVLDSINFVEGGSFDVHIARELMEVEFGRALALQEIAQAAGMSPFHFARVFRSLMGVPPHRFLTAVRLRHAAHLLGQGASVTQTCYDVGFGTLSHFVTAFKERFGINPAQAKGGARCPTLRASLRDRIRAVQRA